MQTQKKDIRDIIFYQNCELKNLKKNKDIIIIKDCSHKKAYFLIKDDYKRTILSQERSYINYLIKQDPSLVEETHYLKNEFVVYDDFFYLKDNEIFVVEDAGSFEGDKEIFLYVFCSPKIIILNENDKEQLKEVIREGFFNKYPKGEENENKR